jgi:hypothetical protein
VSANLDGLRRPGLVAYVAHPVAGDVDANLKRALRWLHWISQQCPKCAVIAPWIANIMSGEDDGDPEQRARGLAHDVTVVKRCDYLILCGGRVSSGMAMERDAMIVAGGKVLDLTHLGDEPPSVTRGLLELRDSAPLVTDRRIKAALVEFDVSDEGEG